MEPTQSYGSFWRRMAAAVIDVIILAAGLTLIEIVLYNAWQSTFAETYEAEIGRSWLLFLAAILVLGLYSVGYEWDRGATPGKQLLGLRVTQMDGSRPGALRLAARWLLHILSFAILGVGFLMAIWTKKKQTLHDLLTGMVVVRSAPVE